MTPPSTIPARVNAYRAEHPGATIAGAARALGLNTRTVERAFYVVRLRERLAANAPPPAPKPPYVRPPRVYRPRPRRPPKPIPDEQRRAMLPMLPGLGERRDDCAHYPEHVDRAGAATSGEAHCPAGCPSFVKRPREWDFAAAIQSREVSSYAMHIRT